MLKLVGTQKNIALYLGSHNSFRENVAFNTLPSILADVVSSLYIVSHYVADLVLVICADD